MRAPEGTLISYATQPGSVAQDGSGGHSPYTKALATTIKQAGLDIFQTFNQVGLAVKRETGRSQQPWVSSSPIDGSFYFVAPVAAAPPVTIEPPQQLANAPPRNREEEPLRSPRGGEVGGTNFDGTWTYTGIGTNCRGSGSGSPSGPVSIGDPGADFVNDGINGASAAAGVAPSPCAYRLISQ